MQDMAALAFIGVGLVVVGLAIGWVRRDMRRQLRRRPRTRVGEAHAGPFVKMTGQLRAQGPVRSPLADVDCAYFEMTVAEKLAPTDEHLTTLFTDKEIASGLALEDETGRIALEVEDATFEHLLMRDFSPGAAWEPRVRADLLARYINARNGRAEGAPMRLHEERLEVGRPVVVFGWVRQGPEGLVLTGGRELRLLGESEQQLLRLRPLDFVPWVLVAFGVLVAAASLSPYFEEPVPPIHLEMTPLPRPAPAPTLPR